MIKLKFLKDKVNPVSFPVWLLVEDNPLIKRLISAYRVHRKLDNKGIL